MSQDRNDRFSATKRHFLRKFLPGFNRMDHDGHGAASAAYAPEERPERELRQMIPIPSADFGIEMDDDRLLRVNRRTGTAEGVCRLGALDRHLIGLLDGRHSMAAMSTSLADHFDLDSRAAFARVRALVFSLTRRGMLEWRNAETG